MTERLRFASFLAHAARPHYEAVGRALADSCELDLSPLLEPGLASLDGFLSDPAPALVFLCGLPYVRARDAGLAVESLAAPVAAGDDEPRYFAALVGRSTDVTLDPRLQMAYNGEDSFSGWVLPRAYLPHDLYSRSFRSGSHRASLEHLLAGTADAAAIDSTVLALEARDNPELAALPILRMLGPAPSPPVVLVNGSPALADRLRSGLVALAASDDGRRALELGLVSRFAAMNDSDYGAVRTLDAAAT